MSNKFKNPVDLNRWYLRSLINFKNKGKDLWNDRYDYSKFIYVNNKTKGEISCPKHGPFWQTPNDHIGKHGCRQCSTEDSFNYNGKDILDRKEYPVDLYFINLISDHENFNKVGISKEYKKRIKNIKVKSRCDISEILIIPLNLEEAYHIEKTLKHKIDLKYKPLIKFPGYTECLKSGMEKEVINEISKILINDFNRSPIIKKILDWDYARKKSND